MAKKRIFAAIDISDVAREGIAAYMQKLRSEFRDMRVRWERPEKLHITIHFAGDLDETELAKFEERVADAAARSSRFTITIDRTGAFIKGRSRANVLWFGLESHGGLERLATLIDESNTRFKPHLTIARLKDAKPARGLIDKHLATRLESIEFRATKLVVYESTLTPTGSVYSVVSKHPLKGIS